MTASMIADPGRALCDAIVENDIIKFNMVLGHRRNTARALNKALFMAVGYEQDEFQQAILHRVAELNEESMKIDLSERANGLLLRSILQDNIHGVIVSLRNPSVDVNCHDDECFKQAVLNNRLKIADVLHSAGADMIKVYADDKFMDRVNRAQGGVTREGRKLVFSLVGEIERSPIPLEIGDFTPVV